MIFTVIRPTARSLLSFEGADLYDDPASDHYTHRDATEALVAMLDNSELRHCGDVGKYLESTELFLSVAAYKRKEVAPPWRLAWATHIVDGLRESFGEEHGDLDGDDRLSKEDMLELGRKVEELVSWYVSRATVWPCEKLRTWTFDRDDLLELVQQLRPAWLNKPAGPSSDGAP